MTYVSLNGMAKLYKSKRKTYPDGSYTIYVYKDPMVISNAEDDVSGAGGGMKSPEELESDREHSRFMNLIRTKTKIKDYCLSNEFNYFWTLTFGEGREDADSSFKKMSKWLEKMRKKHGRFNYIFIPERHADGVIHFHGVTGGFKGKIVDSGVKHRGKKVYNCSDWEYGFSTLSRIVNKKKCASYITKYVTKEMAQEVVGKGKKKYWCSRGLRLPEIEYTSFDLSFGQNPSFENDICCIYNFDK